MSVESGRSVHNTTATTAKKNTTTSNNIQFTFLPMFLLSLVYYIIYHNLQDTVTGFLLAGVGHRTAHGSNFLIVKQDTPLQQVEEAFQSFSTRDDVGIILINQHIASDIRHILKRL